MLEDARNEPNYDADQPRRWSALSVLVPRSGCRGNSQLVKRRAGPASVDPRRVLGCWPKGRRPYNRTSPSMPETAVRRRWSCTLPHNLEAERSVLGAVLVHNDAFNLAAQVIDARRFLPRRAPAHLRPDGRAQRAHQAIDFVTLKEDWPAAATHRWADRLRRLARRRRATSDQRGVLRADRQGEGDAAQPDLRRAQDPDQRVGRPTRTPISSSTRPRAPSSRSPTIG